ncbi:MAG: SDR family NAD(P)-dependent oxidoreductase [Alphaproteobacteria bacterium]|nr:SDR family NAD(P)-dependent oxidoreductase [Alphaproteobacteria bacterium]
MKLSGSLALVTGASSGIGAATARALAAKGARVALVARTRAALEEVAASIRAAGGEAHVFPADVGDPDAVAAMAAQVTADLGVPDLLVNNAGVGRWLSVEETDPDEAVAMMRVPYFAAFFVTRAFIEGMVARGSGRVVNVNSPAGFTPIPGAAGYSAARAALRTFSRCLDAELRGSGVGVTHFTPGKVSTPYFSNNPGAEERIPGIAAIIPTLSPDEVAARLIAAVDADRRHATVPWMAAAIEALNSVAPWLVSALVRSSSWRRP